MGQRHRAALPCGRARAYCLARGESVEEHPPAGQDRRTSLDAAARSMARGASGAWLRAVCRLGLLCRGTVYLMVGYLALRLALAPHGPHGRTGAPASSAGAVQAADVWGHVPLVLLVAGLGAYALTQLIEAVFRPAHATGNGGQVASARGVLVGMSAVLGILPEHRPGCGGDSAEADGAVGAAGHRRYRGPAANRMGPPAPDPGGGPRCGRRRGDGLPVSPARLPGAVHHRGHAPGRWPSSPGRSARWAASRAPSCSCWSASSC
jgi:Domain of Unknown Function (DUF1206)